MAKQCLLCGRDFNELNYCPSCGRNIMAFTNVMFSAVKEGNIKPEKCNVYIMENVFAVTNASSGAVGFGLVSGLVAGAANALASRNSPLLRFDEYNTMEKVVTPIPDYGSGITKIGGSKGIRIDYKNGEQIVIGTQPKFIAQIADSIERASGLRATIDASSASPQPAPQPQIKQAPQQTAAAPSEIDEQIKNAVASLYQSAQK